MGVGADEMMVLSNDVESMSLDYYGREEGGTNLGEYFCFLGENIFSGFLMVVWLLWWINFQLIRYDVNKI